MANVKSLVVCYSRKGNNYVGGSIVNLLIGNTEVIARIIKELTGSDLFQIETVKAYPKDYTETTQVAQDEKRANARPELTGIVAEMNAYDVIYLGYPNWWELCQWRYILSWNLMIFPARRLFPIALTKATAWEAVNTISRNFVRVQPFCLA